MFNIKTVILSIFLLSLTASFVKDKFAGTKVGRMRVNGTINYAVKSDLKNIMHDAEYYAVNLPQKTADYLSNIQRLRGNYEQGKKFVMYDAAFDDLVNCPFGQAFQKSLQNAKSNKDNKIFDFYTKPQLRPFVSKADMEKIKKLKMPLPMEFITKEEADIEMDFNDTCGLFCVVNPKTNHVISFPSVGTKEAEKVQYLLYYLRTYDW